MGKSKAALATKKRGSLGAHGGNRGGVRAAAPKHSKQATGKDPQRGRKER